MSEINYQTDREFRLSDFRAWLATQPPDREFCADALGGESTRWDDVRARYWYPLPCMPCPIAVWVQETTPGAEQVDAACYIAIQVAGAFRYYKMPDELRNVMNVIDREHGGDGVITAGQVLALSFPHRPLPPLPPHRE